MLEFNEELHEYRVDGILVDSVTQILSAEGFIDPTWYDEYSRTRGEYIHRACALWDRKALDLDTLDPVIKPYLAGWDAFLKDSGFEILFIEQPLYNTVFAGTPDRIGKLHGSRMVLEIKSGVPEPWAALQLAGYEVLDGNPCKRIAIQLTVEGKYKPFPYNNRTDRQVFMAATAVHNWKKNNRR